MKVSLRTLVPPTISYSNAVSATLGLLAELDEREFLTVAREHLHGSIEHVH